MDAKGPPRAETRMKDGETGRRGGIANRTKFTNERIAARGSTGGKTSLLAAFGLQIDRLWPRNHARPLARKAFFTPSREARSAHVPKSNRTESTTESWIPWYSAHRFILHPSVAPVAKNRHASLRIETCCRLVANMLRAARVPSFVRIGICRKTTTT